MTISQEAARQHSVRSNLSLHPEPRKREKVTPRAQLSIFVTDRSFQ